MPVPLTLDLDLLRSFVVIAEEKSFTKAADRVGRTQSAVSLQIQRLEAFLGYPVLERGRGGQVELNRKGEFLYERAREILSLNDDVLASLREPPAQTTVRLGIVDEFSARFLPRVIARFAEVAPSIQVEVSVAASCVLGPQIRNGELDLAIIETGLEPRNWPSVEIWRPRLVWVTSDAQAPHLKDPLPLALSPTQCPLRPAWLKDCPWRATTLNALEVIGRNYRIVSTSSSTVAMLGAVAAGQAVTTILEKTVLPEGVRMAEPTDGLPDLPAIPYLMVKTAESDQPMTDLLAAQISDLFAVEQGSANVAA